MARFTRIRWCLTAIASLAICLTVQAQAQTFPERTIKLVVPVPPGGSTDALARLVTLRMQTISGSRSSSKSAGRRRPDCGAGGRSGPS